MFQGDLGKTFAKNDWKLATHAQTPTPARPPARPPAHPRARTHARRHRPTQRNWQNRPPCPPPSLTPTTSPPQKNKTRNKEEKKDKKEKRKKNRKKNAARDPATAAPAFSASSARKPSSPAASRRERICDGQKPLWSQGGDGQTTKFGRRAPTFGPKIREGPPQKWPPQKWGPLLWGVLQVTPPKFQAQKESKQCHHEKLATCSGHSWWKLIWVETPGAVF